MFRACTVAAIMAAGLAVAACSTDHAPTAPETSPVAEGTGTMTEVSSNLFGGNGRGTSGFRIRGTVTDLASERHHVLVVVHSYLGPNGFVDRVSKINVN